MCWSPPHEEARAWLIGEMRGAGLETWVDSAGNTFGATGIRAPIGQAWDLALRTMSAPSLAISSRIRAEVASRHV